MSPSENEIDTLELVGGSSIGHVYHATVARALSSQIKAVLQTGALFRSEKLLLLAATCLARRHAEPGRQAAHMAVRAGASEEQLEEMLLVLYVSRGALAYLDAKAALGSLVAGAPLQATGTPAAAAEPNPEAIYEAFRGYYGGVLPAWVSHMADLDLNLLASVQAVRDIVFSNGHASLKLKELAFVSINVADRYDYGIRRHIKTAAEAGASTAEIVEAMAVAMLDGGNVAWIEGIGCLTSG